MLFLILVIRFELAAWPRYGAAFGMVAMHEDSRYSLFGQVMDDIERSCRFYEHDGATVRVGRFQVYKRPGSKCIQ